MKRPNIILTVLVIIALLILVVFLYTQDKNGTNLVVPETSNTKSVKTTTDTPVEKITTPINDASIERIIQGEDDIIQIVQDFIYKNNSGEYLSEVHNLNTENSPDIWLSAYSFDRSEYEIYYRLYDTSWGDWQILNEDSHSDAYDEERRERRLRKAYGITSITTHPKKIQFKSSHAVADKVVFRFFIF